MKREWKPGQPIPKRYSGMPVTFAWNEVALTHLLAALKERYPSGYASMCDHVAAAMRDFTPPKPEEPTGLGAVVEAIYDNHFVRIDRGRVAWRRVGDTDAANTCAYDEIDVVRVLSEGVPA